MGKGLVVGLALACMMAAPSVKAQMAMDHHHGPEHEMHHGGGPTRPGQDAFAAIQEIVAILEADPTTDWTKVDIEALRHHLIDMNEVTLNAKVTAIAVDGGARFEVTGEGRTKTSIRRMVMAHAQTMAGANGWRMDAAEIADGASLTVTGDDAARIRALGFIGVMTLGAHHQQHHLAIAKGSHPHQTR